MNTTNPASSTCQETGWHNLPTELKQHILHQALADDGETDAAANALAQHILHLTLVERKMADYLIYPVKVHLAEAERQKQHNEAIIQTREAHTRSAIRIDPDLPDRVLTSDMRQTAASFFITELVKLEQRGGDSDDDLVHAVEYMVRMFNLMARV